jgi:uncharacterized membrane protein YqaE (UPF0057 family)
MNLKYALFLPFMVFFSAGRPVAGVVCLVLQLSLIGWLPAVAWAIRTLTRHQADTKTESGTGAATGGGD